MVGLYKDIYNMVMPDVHQGESGNSGQSGASPCQIQNRPTSLLATHCQYLPFFRSPQHVSPLPLWCHMDECSNKLEILYPNNHPAHPSNNHTEQHPTDNHHETTLYTLAIPYPSSHPVHPTNIISNTLNTLATP